jgi:hypothetical protein
MYAKEHEHLKNYLVLWLVIAVGILYEWLKGLFILLCGTNLLSVRASVWCGSSLVLAIVTLRHFIPIVPAYLAGPGFSWSGKKGQKHPPHQQRYEMVGSRLDHGRQYHTNGTVDEFLAQLQENIPNVPAVCASAQRPEGV